jgi:tetratricopeptide (TPR) repeat protein
VAWVTAGLACAAAAGWCLVCVSADAAARAPDPDHTYRSVLTRPRPEDFREAADARVLAAVAVLQDRALAGTERLDRYTRDAAAARALYGASLEGCSYQPLTVARLAALRFEETPPLSDAAWSDWAATLDLAASMAPRTASVQVALGELLVRMGRPDEGLVCYARALRLDPTQARRVIAVLGAFGVSPDQATAALPRSAPLLLALRTLYERDARLGDYADVLDPDLPSCSPELLATWTDARLAARQADLAVDRLQGLAYATPAQEAARCVHLSRAYLALGDGGAAERWATRARTAAPEDARALEQSAQAALATGQFDAAREFARRALASLARAGGSNGARARLYEIAGRAEERRGRMDAAHDAYSHALALDPNRTTARRRLEAMRAAAGLAVPSATP